jgi:hypothetical protein
VQISWWEGRAPSDEERGEMWGYRSPRDPEQRFAWLLFPAAVTLMATVMVAADVSIRTGGGSTPLLAGLATLGGVDGSLLLAAVIWRRLHVKRHHADS